MIKKGSVSYFLLLALEKTIEGGTPLLDFLASPRTFVWTGYRTNLNYSTLYKTVQQLRLKGYIETQKDGHQIFLRLLDKGRQELILKKLLENKTWDGKWRVVIFDIPEKHRKLRNVLRSQLRQWQFVPWQKSVWASKKNLEKELDKFLNDTKLSRWVRVLVASKA